jgi:uncharacterized protein (DUF3084 family)
MLKAIILLIVALANTAVFASIIFYKLRKRSSSIDEVKSYFDKKAAERELLKNEIDKTIENLIPAEQLLDAVRDLKDNQNSLKTEKGRVSISRTELEIIENRLRELEEIERELAASNIEIKEEQKIIDKQNDESKGKTEAIEKKVDEFLNGIETTITLFKDHSNIQDLTNNVCMKMELTLTKIAEVLTYINTGNSQFLKLKQRYNALDIEYAHLYEKYASTEEANTQ